MARINIPTDPTEIISLAKAIFDQRTALGEKTPLGGIKWDKIGPDITQAGTFDNEADRLRKESRTTAGETRQFRAGPHGVCAACARHSQRRDAAAT